MNLRHPVVSSHTRISQSANHTSRKTRAFRNVWFKCVAQLIHKNFETTHSYVWHDSCTCVPHSFTWVPSLIRPAKHVDFSPWVVSLTLINESCHAYAWVVFLTFINESCHAYEWVLLDDESLIHTRATTVRRWVCWTMSEWLSLMTRLLDDELDERVTHSSSNSYGVAMISRMLKNIGLFCKRALQKRPVSCKETCIFKHPTNRSHPIWVRSHTWIPQSFLDGYCSTVQGLLDWFEVDLGFAELLFIQIDLCVIHMNTTHEYLNHWSIRPAKDLDFCHSRSKLPSRSPLSHVTHINESCHTYK